MCLICEDLSVQLHCTLLHRYLSVSWRAAHALELIDLGYILS